MNRNYYFLTAAGKRQKNCLKRKIEKIEKMIN